MKVKLNEFQEKWIEIEDAKFLVIELDYNELATASLVSNEKKEVKIDFSEFVNKVITKSVKNWEGLTDNEGKEISFNAVNRERLPFQVKQVVFNKISSLSQLETEKKTV